MIIIPLLACDTCIGGQKHQKLTGGQQQKREQCWRDLTVNLLKAYYKPEPQVTYQAVLITKYEFWVD